jgi:hypothetical protein
MDITPSQVEPVTMSEVLAMASWDRPRTTAELRSFIEQREAIISQE